MGLIARLGMKCRVRFMHGYRVITSCSAQVVLATNIAETSLTIEDVVYVVDTGKLKARTGPART
jgi:hypothetical protein